MVKFDKATQFQGFDYNDYVFSDTSAWVWNGVAAPNGIQLYIAGTQANLQVAMPVPPIPPLANMAWTLAQIPQPVPGGPVTNIGPQYPWPFHGTVGGPLALPALALNNLTNPLNNTSVQRTLFRVLTNDVFVYFLNQRMAAYLYAALSVAPALAAAGPGVVVGGVLFPNWPLPVPVLLEAEIGQYEFERQWIWLLYVRAVADADADVHVYMEG
ncbi:hypothetical protein LCGC14_2350940 [marine sediment metagenome]|uniref:Uncharacterized protein n=1 Tax=marine sediment metagenome TaxID=412755 RepID=A0A0F9CWQ6_9ZZZZ